MTPSQIKTKHVRDIRHCFASHKTLQDILKIKFSLFLHIRSWHRLIGKSLHLNYIFMQFRNYIAPKYWEYITESIELHNGSIRREDWQFSAVHKESKYRDKEVPGNFFGFLIGTNFAPIAKAIGGPKMNPRASMPGKEIPLCFRTK